ncbi:Os03g0379000 [Oryza sativa Japonica Group]|uniref:Os03g0379000 protein n=1 Tax=Oryza sativa subsp. japonica TaxID=39947 RepID=A0A0P0VYU6_ORYSJ|nr:Os03g0379000 [Oryza sativa Japonica Group]
MLRICCSELIFARRLGWRLLNAVDNGVSSSSILVPKNLMQMMPLGYCLLGLVCSNPNPSDWPSMTEVVQVISRSAALQPDMPLVKLMFVWSPKGGCVDRTTLVRC